MLCAWGFTETGERVLLGGLPRDARGRAGLALARTRPGDQPRAPSLRSSSSGRRPTASAARFIGCVTCSPSSRERERVRLAYWRALDEATGAEDGKRRLRTLIGELDGAGFAAAAACLADGLDALCVHLRYPLRHRRRWRSTNLFERSLGEVRRRTKVIARFPGDTSCLSLCWAVLDLVISQSNGVTFSDLDCQAIDRLSRERAERATGEEVVAA